MKFFIVLCPVLSTLLHCSFKICIKNSLFSKEENLFISSFPSIRGKPAIEHQKMSKRNHEAMDGVAPFEMLTINKKMRQMEWDEVLRDMKEENKRTREVVADMEEGMAKEQLLIQFKTNKETLKSIVSSDGGVNQHKIVHLVTYRRALIFRVSTFDPEWVNNLFKKTKGELNDTVNYRQIYRILFTKMF